MNTDRSTTGLLLALGLVVLAAGACTTSSGVAGENAIAQARYALFDAEANGAEQLAASEMQIARERLVAAEKALEQRKPERAARLAQESTATARLATANAALLRATKQAGKAARVERDADMLRETTEAAREEQR